MALDLGAISMFWYCFRERDKVLDLFEMSTGQRMHTRYFQVGGVIEDIPLGFEPKLRAFCEEMPNRVDQYEALLDRNEIFLRRTKGVGIVPRERLLELGVTGPAAARRGRALGPAQDRADCLAYGDFDFSIPVGTVGDGYDRYRVPRPGDPRVGADHLPGARGPARGAVPRRRPQVLAAAARRALDLDGGADPPLQARHRGLPRRRPASSTTRSKRPRGELGCFVVADGSSRPARVHFRDPSFVNLQALREMCVGGYVADLIQNLGMLDPILGGIDR